MKKFLLSVVAMCVLGVGMVSAQVADPPIKPQDTSLPTGVNYQEDGRMNFDAFYEQFIPRIIEWFIGFIAIVSVFMVIWGGYQFFTAMGDTSKAENAVKTISWATTGLTIALLSYIIVQIILNIQLTPV